jgi:1,4-alpha-glucan branching enzyme
MTQKFLNITIIAHQGYIRHIKDDEQYRQHNSALFTAISDTYLPLLKMFEALDRDNIPFRVGMVFSPTLCALLTDSTIQQQYIDWLDKVISLGQAELAALDKKTGAYTLAENILNTAVQNRLAFIEEYHCNLLGGFDRFIRAGNIEVLATCATYAFLPHYADMPEVCNAQIEVGLNSHKHFFSLVPEGFWLPYLGYTPGIEKTLKAYGLNYTILDTHGLLFANPLPEKGIFSPVRSAENSFAFFARDGASFDGKRSDESGTDNFMNNPLYRNQNRDIVFEKDGEAVSQFLGNGARIPSGYKYWTNGATGDPLDGFYNPDAAREQAKRDAALFFTQKKERFAEAAKICPDSALSLVCTLNARMLGELWHEGIWWLEEIFRLGAADSDVAFAVTESLLQGQFSLQSLNPYLSATCGAGYGENLLDNNNAWLIRYVRKASDRMIDLADRFSGERGLKVWMLNLAAKEVLLAQASDWPKMLHAWRSPEYAEERFKESILAFTTVFDSLGSNTMSIGWLTNMEKKHPLFPWLNYRVFGKKHIKNIARSAHVTTLGYS